MKKIFCLLLTGGGKKVATCLLRLCHMNPLRRPWFCHGLLIRTASLSSGFPTPKTRRLRGPRVASLAHLVAFLPPLLIFATALCAESLWDYHPIHGGGNAIALGQANLDLKRGGHDGEVSYNKANAFLYMLLPISRSSYFLPRVEWNTFSLDWNKNPKFHQTRFNYVQFALTFLSTAEERWRWIARADYNIDAQHFSEPKAYGLFSALLWGTHEIHRKWHYHVGALGYTGFEGQEIYPIIGFDFSPNKKWMFQIVFPINYSIEYTLAKEWRLSLKGRPLKERFRVGDEEPQPRSVFSYSSMGAELNIHYEKFLRLEAELFVGYSFGGSLYIKDRTGHHPLYTNIQGTPYAGANLNWGF